MNITTVASSLDWKTNNKGIWKVLIDDLIPNSNVTFDEGYTTSTTGKMVVVTNASSPIGNMTYETSETNVVNVAPLYGVGTAYDTVEAVEGKKTVRIASVDLGSLSWTRTSSGLFRATLTTAAHTVAQNAIPNIISSIYAVISINRLNGPSSSSPSPDMLITITMPGDEVYVNNMSYTDATTFKTAMSGVMLYYELAESIDSDVTAQSLSLTTGDNTLSGASFDTTYEGTDYSIPLIRNCKYIYRDGEGNESLLTGSMTNTSKAVVGGQDKLINLTHWFGRSREPSIEDFYKLYPTWKTYDIPYNQGSVLNYKGTGVETIGFNAYDHSTGTASLLGGNRYQICGTFTSVSYVDIFENAEIITLDSANCFTPANDGILTVVGGNNTDTLVHLVWSGYKNFGEPEYKWEPFTRNVKELPISTYFPEGMNGLTWDVAMSDSSRYTGDVHDELTSEQVISRIGVIDGGDVTYSDYTYTSGSSTYPYGYCSFTLGTKKNGIFNMVCSAYPTQSSFGDGDKSMFASLNSTIIYIINSSFIGLTGDEIKARMTGVKFYYELATPVVTQIDQPLNLAYHVNDFGTEHSLPQNTTTLVTTDLKALIKYNTDYMRMNSQLADIFPTVKSLVQQEQDDYIMKVDSYAPNARVGAADNLIDKNAEGTPAEFTYRTSGGDVDLTDGTAVAKKIKGTTLNLNQLVHDTNQNTVTGEGQVEVEDAVVSDVASLVVSGRSLVKNQLVPLSLEETEDSANGVLEVTDAVAGDAKGLVLKGDAYVKNQLYRYNWESPASNASRTITELENQKGTLITIHTGSSSDSVWLRASGHYVVGHKYLFKSKVTATYNAEIRPMYSSIATTTTATVTANTATLVSIPFTATAANNYFIFYYNLSNTAQANDIITFDEFQIVDLTQLTNGDSTKIAAISTWDDLVAYDPRFASYVAYNTGTVEGATPQVKVSGKNLFGGNTYVGGLNLNRAFLSNTTAISSPYTTLSTYSYYGIGIKLYLLPGTYTISSDMAISSGSILRSMTQYANEADCTNYNKMVVRVNGTFNGNAVTYTVQPGAPWVVFTWTAAAGNTTFTWSWIQVELGSVATSYEPYHDGGTAQSPVPLYGVGTTADSYDAVTGKVGHQMASVDLGNLTWGTSTASQYQGFFYFSGLTDIVSGLCDMMTSGKLVFSSVNWQTDSFSQYPDNIIAKNSNNKTLYVKCTAYTSESDFKTAMSGVYLYYPLATPTEELLTSSTISLQQGNNVALQTDGGRTTPFSLTYDGTEFTLPLDSTHKYAFSDNGTKSVITGSTEQAVTGGQDMLVDVTRMFNGDATAINAVTSWANMAAVMPEYNSTVAYNEGEVVGRSGGVTTAKWNQLVQNGNFADGTNNWTPMYGTGSVSNGVYTYTLTDDTSSSVAAARIQQNMSLVSGHTYIVKYSVNVSKITFIRFYGGNITISFTPEAINTWYEKTGLATATRDTPVTYFYNNDNRALSNGDTVKYKDLQIFDLTEIYGAGHEPSTVEEFEADCAKWGKDLTQYQPYDAGTAMGGSATFSDLHGVGDVKETLDVVTGEKDVKFGSVDLGTLNWGVSNTNYGGNGYYRFGTSAYPSDAKQGTSSVPANVVCDRFIRGKVTDQTGASALPETVSIVYNALYIVSDKYKGWTAQQFKSAMSGVMLYYELTEPSTTTETPQPLTFTAGLNNVHEENMDITGTPVTMEYTGTDYTIATKSARKYIKTIDGVTELVTGVSSVDVRGGRDNLIDLTRMFGAGLEPGTLDAFYSLFPTWLGYRLPYNKGSLLNFKGTGLKSVGFNLLDLAGRTLGEPQNTNSANTTVRGPFDETKYYVGFSHNNYYYPSNVVSYSVTSTQVQVKEGSSNAYYGISFPIRVIPGMTYRFENYVNGLNFSFYTYNGEWISYLYGQYIEAPENAYWCLIGVIPMTSNTTVTWTDPCVHLQWSGTRNGDYEQYWSYTRPVPTLTYFPDGMNGRGDVYDEMNERNYVKRFSKVDLGTLTWSHTSSGTYGWWYTSISNIKRAASTSSVGVVISDNYVAVAAASLDGTNSYKDCIAVGSANSNILINNGSSTDSPTGWLVYELATPVTTTYDEAPNLTAQISDYGTEESLPTNGYEPTTAPFNGVVLYASDYARTITKLPENYISKESMQALLTLLGSVHNGTFTMTYNSDTGEYSFNFTPNE